METQDRDWVEEQLQRYRQQLEEVVAKRRSGELKTLSDMEEEVSRVSQRNNQRLLEGMLALKKTPRRKES
jgi:hypothetical protein